MNAGDPERRLERHEPAGARTVTGLGAVLILVVLIVGVAWHYTRQQIAENVDRRTLEDISTVLPPDRYDNQPHRDVVQLDTGSGQPVAVYRARRNGAPAAAVLTIVAPDGYIGPIRLLVGIAADGRVLGVRVMAQVETPGIGGAIAAAHSPFMAAFVARSFDDPPPEYWSVRSDGGQFDAIAGATVSSRAVVGGVKRAVEYFASHQDEIFAPRREDQATP
ncbi:MAG: RnfABCDGE type electron transport complex subunit G [Gammaproteobacteria bacterium]